MGKPVPPPADPVAIRACLTPEVVAEFDAEWELVLEQSEDLAPVHALLGKWRHIAYGELTDPGSYFRLLTKVEHILASGEPPPGSVTGEEMKALIRERLRRDQAEFGCLVEGCCFGGKETTVGATRRGGVSLSGALRPGSRSVRPG